MAFQRSHRLNLLRLVVLLLVALAGIKFFFRDSFTLELHKHVSKDSEFWGDAGDTGQDTGPQSQALEVPAAKITALRQEPGQQVPRDVSATEMRLVHLDLKGAAPRVSYLEQVFPLLSQLGANGILIEYEDMFPFKGELEILRSPYAYSEEDIERIQQLAELHKLEVVPLVQTFGHVEFILKHEKYQHLREVERFPNSFNPHVPDTLALLKSILSQVMEKHRRSTWIHIGADEVFHLGEGMDSKNWMSHNKGDTGTMYLKHIKEVLGFIAAQYWGLRALMWDDMLRKISAGALRESGIAKHVSPVVWFYAPDFEAEQIGPFLAKYAESGFDAVWFASAFKGTTGPAQSWPPLSYHLKNHLSWLKVMQALPRLAPLRCQGIVLTGWQRYDHYSVLCELLPVGIPSLAICLQTLVNGEPPPPCCQHRASLHGRAHPPSPPPSGWPRALLPLSLPSPGGFTEETKRKVLDTLGFQSMQLEQSTCEGRGAFPGVEIYHMVEQVNSHLKESILKALEEESAIKGWFSPYHRKRQFGNPRNLESFGSKVLKLHEDWESFVHDLRAHLERVYFPDTVEEWLEENINPYLDQLRDLVRDYQAIIRLNARPKVM
ncbi:hexosaminidase D-like isoform X2 [Athene cunicularia]|nr:hexosaminidase D-like isoform X2 [Athene cunicularia]XP_026715125.1 hexosaminidase D-like isoform X2 [Athene cunicularia]XP_026715126.1 hexosaminidase D-like isoform X2 [Athene cunicularia]